MATADEPSIHCSPPAPLATTFERFTVVFLVPPAALRFSARAPSAACGVAAGSGEPDIAATFKSSSASGIIVGGLTQLRRDFCWRQEPGLRPDCRSPPAFTWP
eukprot:2177556-Prymnesium_polylepis.2